MKRLLGFLILVLCCTRVQAQNVEGQIIASQYGTWEVAGYVSNGYSFAPASCRVQGGASYFNAFTNGTPVRIVDGQPSLNETVTPTSNVINNVTCAISIAPVNAHQLPFSITSATGGLQEAINNNLTTPAQNTIILTAAWYQLVANEGSTAAAVIAAAQGSAALGLVDITTIPTSWYQWNGTQYTKVAVGGSAGNLGTLVNDLVSNNASNSAAQDLYDFYATGPTVYNPQAAITAAAANNGAVTIMPGVGRTPFTNTGNVRAMDMRADVPATAISATEAGAVCDLRNVYGTLGVGSTTVTILSGYSALFSTADIGRTLVAVGSVSGIPTAFESKLLSITDTMHAIMTTAAPFNQTVAHQMDLGHDDRASISQSMTTVGAGGTLVFPEGNCLTHTQTLAGQSVIGLGPTSQVTGFPGEDVFAAPDPSQTTGVSQGVAHIHDLTINVDNRIDATHAWQIINDSGTTSKPAMYRPGNQNSGITSNPVAPGWFQGSGPNLSGATNGIANTVATAVICVPPSLTAPAVGQKVVFPYLTGGVFTTTVSSTAGSCSGSSAGFNPRTLAASVPVTATQAEYFVGTSPQTIAASISGVSCPSTITLTNSINPVPGFESNVAPFGLVQVDNEQFSYFGKSNAANPTPANTLYGVSCAQNGTTRAAHSSLATIVPLNQFQPTYPWPVTPTLNTGDTTPAGTAGYFPGSNFGNMAFAFPVATGINPATGTTGSWTTGSVIENLSINFWPTDINPPFTGGNAVNHNGAFYFVQYPYAARFQHIAINQMFYGVTEGLPSIENGNWTTSQPTADGGSWENLAIRAAYPWNFVAGNQNTFKDFNAYSEEGTNAGGVVGADTCYYFTQPRNDQTGAVAESASLDTMTNFYCEPEAGAHAGAMPEWEFDTYTSEIIDMHVGGPGEFYIGCCTQHWFGGNFNNASNMPVVNFGLYNTTDLVSTLGTEPKSNTYGSSSLINWGNASKFSGTTAQAFGTPGGPYGQLQVGNSREPIASQTNETFNTGNLTAPYASSGGGFITPEEFDISTSFDPQPMTTGWTFDDTAPITHSYTACALGNNTSFTYCNSYRFNFNEIPIGAGQRLVPGKYMLYLSAKDITQASNAFTFDVGTSCTGILGAYTVPVTNAWPTTYAGFFSAQIDLTSANAAGCYLHLYFNGATTADTFEYSFVDFAPLPENLQAQTITATTINVPGGTTGGTATGCAQSPVTGINGGYVCPTKGVSGGLNANQGSGDTTATLVSASGFSSAGCFFVDAEYECYTGISGSILTGITRGAYTTTPTTHSTGAPVVSVGLVLGSVQQPPEDVVAYGSGSPTILAVNNGFPAVHSGLSVMDINSGSNELWFDVGGHINQVNTTGLNTFNAPVAIGNNTYTPIADTRRVWQNNGSNEATAPMGFGAGHAGTLNVIQTPTIAAPSVQNFATGSGSNTYSYVCSGTDYDGNLINGTTGTVTGVPTTFGGINPFISINCPWSAGIASFQIYRTVGGPTQGLMASVVGNPGSFSDFNSSGGGGTPPGGNSSNPKLVLSGSGTPTMQLGPTNISSGTGAPTTTCGTAPIGSGSLWLRTDGGISTSLYSCAGTTWTAVTVP